MGNFKIIYTLDDGGAIQRTEILPGRRVTQQNARQTTTPNRTFSPRSSPLRCQTTRPKPSTPYEQTTCHCGSRSSPPPRNRFRKHDRVRVLTESKTECSCQNCRVGRVIGATPQRIVILTESGKEIHRAPRNVALILNINDRVRVLTDGKTECCCCLPTPKDRVGRVIGTTPQFIIILTDSGNEIKRAPHNVALL